ncbi:hypothetical protein ACIA49_33575 [Kribbella sp. NPDC051587]|uniref:hypothetical protein n=1 Tax=Kribbella sp. NPDC051587 TaxID=3364119 RepID=UPI0037B2DF38
MKRFFVLPTAVAVFGLAAVVVAPATAAAPAEVQAIGTGPTTEQVSAFVTPDLLWVATKTSERLGIELSPVQRALIDVIDPHDYQCTPTEMTTWVQSQLHGWTVEDQLFLYGATLQNLAGYASMVVSPDTAPSYGPHGEFTKPITKTFGRLRAFWDIKSDDIHLLPMHGSIMTDRSALYTTFRTIFGRDETTSSRFADTYSNWAKGLIARLGDAPLLTLNAFAFSGVGDSNPGLAALPDAIVMGDGIQQAFTALGLGDVSPQSVLAHEFGHHIQYEDGLFSSPLTGAEASRRTELMADAFAAYFLAHARGAALQWHRVQTFVRVFHSIGDCGFTDPGHHGTPDQRTRSAVWAYGLVITAPNRGHIMPSRTFAALFDAVLPVLVAPDAVH